MTKNKSKSKMEITGIVLVLLMVLLQGFYGVFALVDAAAFSNIRGTELFSANDSDWVKIYGSRTVFISLILAYLLYVRNYSVLMWCALLGTIMPITDGLLAYEAQAPLKVTLKHLATIAYLVVTFVVLRKVVTENDKQHGLNH